MIVGAWVLALIDPFVLFAIVYGSGSLGRPQSGPRLSGLVTPALLLLVMLAIFVWGQAKCNEYVKLLTVLGSLGIVIGFGLSVRRREVPD